MSFCQAIINSSPRLSISAKTKIIISVPNTEISLIILKRLGFGNIFEQLILNAFNLNRTQSKLIFAVQRNHKQKFDVFDLHFLNNFKAKLYSVRFLLTNSSTETKQMWLLPGRSQMLNVPIHFEKYFKSLTNCLNLSDFSILSLTRF